MRIWLARLLIGLVFLFNVQCALVFLLWPGRYASGFELAGALGEALVRAMGLLFLMWNVPYAVALWNPERYRISLYEALAMQAIGLVGETWIYLNLSSIHIIARSSLSRFIIFDGFGLILLLTAVWVVRKIR